jgi:hypothetical protein
LGVYEEGLIEDWKELDNEYLYDSHFSLNIVREMKVRKIKLAGQVAPTGKKETHNSFCWEILKEMIHVKAYVWFEG